MASFLTSILSHDEPIITWTSETVTSNRLRPTITIPQDDDGSLAWLASNLEQLAKQHGDKWVLVRSCKVIEESEDAIKLEQVTTRLGIQNPYITKIPPPSKTWRTAYGIAVR
jgi:hypothetical protein